MASYPTLTGGSVALYPVTKTLKVPSEVRRALDDSEQRWQRSAPLHRLQLKYSDLSDTDRQSIQTFFDSIKGGYDSTWDITLGSTTYSYCCLKTDALACREQNAELWDLTVDILQVKKSGVPTGAYASSFPSLTGAITTRRPWGYSRDFLNSTVDVPTGKRYSYYNRSAALMSWNVGGDNLPDADITTLIAFFVGCQGRYRTFSFTDPETATAYATSRFETEEFIVEHVGPNQNSLQLQVVQVA